MPTAEEMHPRKAVRAALVEALKGKTDAGQSVFDSRDIPMTEEAMPAVLVYTKRDRIDPDYQHEPGPRRRLMDVSVEIYDAGDEAAGRVDRISWQVENAIRADHTLGKRVERAHYTESDMAFADQGEFSLSVEAMTFEVAYWTQATDDAEDAPGGITALPREVLVGYSPDVGEAEAYAHVWEPEE